MLAFPVSRSSTTHSLLSFLRAIPHSSLSHSSFLAFLSSLHSCTDPFNPSILIILHFQLCTRPWIPHSQPLLSTVRFLLRRLLEAVPRQSRKDVQAVCYFVILCKCFVIPFFFLYLVSLTLHFLLIQLPSHATVPASLILAKSLIHRLQSPTLR